MPSDKFQRFLSARQLVVNSATGSTSIRGVLSSQHLTLRAYKARNGVPSLWKEMSRTGTSECIEKARKILSLGDDIYDELMKDASLEQPIAIHKEYCDVDHVYTQATRAQHLVFDIDKHTFDHVLSNRRNFHNNIESFKRIIQLQASSPTP
ncbi:hypothetical protein THRCLA_10198 [Thraustotheca clavata]|uniref:Uncharacterized protein n=1 Tax=Thraustotheca clavata TaxID=74557 RepID=A0A1V9YSC9_9STRA|nr:hypothetical protein THRCLA_10198 [Thraustotheca clavata]